MDSPVKNRIVMNRPDYSDFSEMRVFMHHIYEFKKGVRSLILCTMCRTCADFMIQRLERQHIEYLCQPVSGNKVNLYFGKRACLDAVRSFVDKPLNLLTPEEDFMLGAMLGYDIGLQCERFCQRKMKSVALRAV